MNPLTHQHVLRRCFYSYRASCLPSRALPAAPLAPKVRPMTELATHIQKCIEKALPGAHVTVEDPDGAHLSATVIAPQFAGVPRIRQHQMVYAALGDAFEDTLHALQLTTRAQ